MPRKKTGKPSHRPQISIDWILVDEYLRAHLSGSEIAEILGIHPDTLYERTRIEKGSGFSAYAAQKKEAGKGLLLYRQYKSALQGNTQMMLHLGRLWRGQGKEDAPNELQILEQMAAANPPRAPGGPVVALKQPILREEEGQENALQDELGST